MNNLRLLDVSLVQLILIIREGFDKKQGLSGIEVLGVTGIKSMMLV
tara:strand:- start:145 stop:282 length:138 start_codon:yes stop_codon:yes gene_type:complete